MVVQVLFCLFLFLINGQVEKVDGQVVNIKVGVLMPKGIGIDALVGYNVSAGTLMEAVKIAKDMQVYDPTKINITFAWYFDQCDEALSIGYTSRLVHDDGVSVIMGPVCSESMFVVGAFARNKNIPVFLWGPASPIQFSPRANYPTTLPFAGSVRGTFSSMSYLTSQYNWTNLAFVYTTLNDINQGFSTCKYFAESFESQSSASTNISETYIRHALNATVASFQSILTSVNNRARIIVSCLETQMEKRNYMRAAMLNNMVNQEYVHIFIQVTSIGFGEPPFWVGNNGDGLDAQIKEASKSVLIIDKFLNTTEQNSTKLDDIYKNIYNWPFYCTDCPKNGSASNLAVYLGDSLLSYLILLNRTYTQYNGTSQLKNATAILSQFQTSENMPSILGNSYRLSNGIRVAKYTVIGLDTNGNPANFALLDSAYIPSTDNDSTSIWATRGGFVPTTTPRCGFSNELCPPSPIFYTVIVIASVIGFLLIIVLLGISLYFFQRQQRRRLNALWQIPYPYLIKSEEKTQMTKSRNSMASTNTDSSRSTIMRKNTEHTEFVYFQQQIVVARKHQYPGKWSEQDESEFRKMRAIDHTNLNKFLGVSLVGSSCLTIWETCVRGNIIEVIKVHSYRMDAYIMTAMIRNIIEGLFFIHNSKFIQHGTLSSYCCVVGDRFDVKIQLYGLGGLKSRTTRHLNTLSALYVAPEHLHGQQTEVGSQEGDIYSLAIICSVILNMKPAYNCEEADDDSSEIVRSIARGKYPPVRPMFEIDPSIEVNPELVSLIKKMWAEHPPERPKIADIREIMIKSISTSRSSNLMDYMFALMENNAAELEKDVQQRTLELLEEQKKADVLLYRMMPRDAADCLKLGQTVTPEVYESATVFFSDIVSFTVLASKSTPLQIINFLNDVYTLADSVLDKYDVYKVETIGDGMHVVSGVPKRNGNNHVREISNMAIDFQRAVKTLRMHHLPDQEIQMRVGVHSGSAVAGIVGMTNPRYIVFGDTVNISAKMEASGRAGRIHISSNTKALIQSYFPNKYTIFERGETLIKGVGPMHTHWLVAPESVANFQP